MRIPYAPSTPSRQEDEEIYHRIAERRHPRPLIPLDLALLHSPAVADGWNSFLGAIRSRTVLDAGLLELAVCRVAVLNDAVYEWNAHAPLALKAGVLPNQLAEAKKLPFLFENAESGLPHRPVGSTLTDRQWVVLLYTDQMTRGVKVEGRVFDLLQQQQQQQDGAQEGLFSHREIVELTASIAAYNCVSRFLVALDVGENNARKMKEVEELVAAAASASK
jgi:AhpD family alkylhydroperoxidase